MSDSDFEDIMDGIDVSSDEEFSSDMNENLEEPPQLDPDTADSSAPKTRPRTRPNNAKKYNDKYNKHNDKYNELSWTSTEPPQPRRRHSFDGRPGINVIVQSCDPLEIFELIVTDEIVDHIVTYSNLYVNQYIGNKEFKKTSRLCKWEDIIAPEIRLHLATLIYPGMLNKPKDHLYYTKSKRFETPGFRRIISQIKMVLLEKLLHFVDNKELGNSYNKAAKLQPILGKLVKRFKLLCEFEYDISTDESLLLWKGRLCWKQYIFKKI